MFYFSRFQMRSWILSFFVLITLGPLAAYAQSELKGSDMDFEEARKYADHFFESQKYDFDEFLLFNQEDPNDNWLYTKEDYLAGRDPKRTSGRSSPWGVPFIRRQYTCCFYNHIPTELYAYAPVAGNHRTVKKIRKKLMPLVITNKVYREIAPSNKAADAVYRRLLNMPIAKNPIVAYGLANLKYKVINDKGGGKKVSSPTHYDRTNGILYVNSEDIRDYGFVVILHESLHAALTTALDKKIISNKTYGNLAMMNTRYFGNFTGYVGVVGAPDSSKWRNKYKTSIDLNLYSSGMLGPEKAFTIGYTYALLRYYRAQLSAADRAFANKFISDVESNKKIANVTIDVPTFSLAKFNLRLISDDKNRASKVKYFIEMFNNPNSSARRDIRVLHDALLAKQR